MTLLKELAYSTLLCFSEDLFHLSQFYSLLFPRISKANLYFLPYFLPSISMRPALTHIGKVVPALCTAQKEPQPLKNLGKTKVAVYKPV